MPMFLVHLASLQAPITQADLVDDGLVLTMTMTEKRGLAGGPATVELEIENPGLVLLRQTGYVAVVDTPTGLLADGRILARARIARIPDDLGQRTVTLRLECAPSSWKGLVKAAANNSVGGAGIVPYAIPAFPEPGVGTIAVAFAGSPAARWDAVKAGAIAVSAAFQNDLSREPLSSLLNFQTLSVANAIAVLTIPDGQAARDAARYGRSALIALSGDKDPTHGVPFAAGIVVAIRPAPGGQVDLIVNMASTLLSTAGITPSAAGDRTTGGLPYYEPLFPGQRDDLSSAVLEGRSATWHLDPVSHEIALDDTIHGQRVVDLADLGDAASERRAAVDSPVSHVKLKLVAEYNQNAFGRCDIAPRVNGVGGYGQLASLASSPSGFPQAETGGENNVGWTVSGPVVKQTTSLTGTFFTGRTFTVTYRDDVHTWVDAPFQPGVGPRLQSSWKAGDEYSIEHAEQGQFVIYTVNYNNWFFGYNVNQVRRETVDIVLDLEVQPFALGEDTLDLGTIQLMDVNSLEGVDPFQDGVAYNTGDRVLLRGRVYQCLADRVIGLFKLTTRVKNGVPSTTVTTPYWQDLGVSTPMGDPRNPSYFATTRGRKSIEAALMRCRAAGLKRLQAFRVSKMFPWSVGRDLSIRDEVRMLIRDGDTVLPIRGKVEELVRRVDGGGVASVEVTVTVCLGSGRDDAVAPVTTPYANGYATSAYTASVPTSYVPSTVPGFVAAGTTGERDIEYALSGDSLKEPLDFFKLSDPSYACLSVIFNNGLEDQMAKVQSLIGQKRSPQYVTQDYPSTLSVTMRPLRTEGNLQRSLLCHAALTRVPRGVDMINGGEP